MLTVSLHLVQKNSDGTIIKSNRNIDLKLWDRTASKSWY